MLMLRSVCVSLKIVALRLALVGALVMVPLISGASSAWAAVLAKVDLSRQRMEVYVNGRRHYNWIVSTGRDGWRTPAGRYYPFALTRHYYSKKWKMNLPYLVSISSSGIAIHGTEQTGKLGRPASHGCIRLSIGNAARFYRLVESYGMSNTVVIVTR
jgi:lipoprotein-anchoring transpeptidase ErfK/SrfK